MSREPNQIGKEFAVYDKPSEISNPLWYPRLPHPPPQSIRCNSLFIMDDG